MNLTFTQTNTVDLLARQNEQGSIGADIRKELTRRKAVGLWIGPDFLTAKAQAEVELKVMAKAAPLPVARKVEKKMAGRGR